MVMERAAVWTNDRLLLSAKTHEAFPHTSVTVCAQLHSGTGAITNISKAEEGGLRKTRPDHTKNRAGGPGQPKRQALPASG